MTSARLARKALIGLSGLALAACGGAQDDSARFESLGRMVASIPIPLDPDRPAQEPAAASRVDGLRPAVRVQVMDPHDLWDARDAALRGMVAEAAPRVVEAAAPAMAQAAAEAIGAPLARVAEPVSQNAQAAHTVIQLGAFSTEAAARAAWNEVVTGAAAGLAADLEPRFQKVQVNGRDFTRLRVSLPQPQAEALCRLAQVSDPWCRGAA